jgi:hypothetical protein
MRHKPFTTLEDIVFDLCEPFFGVGQDKRKDVGFDGVKLSL